jgi:hypothetical protein
VTVERWLAQNAPVDTTRPTVVLADWYGHDGFRFHVYTKTDVADPDTGYNVGLLRSSRKMSAWGGSTADDLGTTDARRIWFYDMSAGPEGWTGNWNVDDADIDGDGEPDYRLPPSWEYGAYRTADALAGDLAKVIRYVAVNLLFTSSPLYPPYHEANTLPQTVELDMQIASSWKKKPLSQLIKPSLLLAETQQLPTGATYSISTQRVAWSGETSSCYLQWVRNVRCYPDRSNYPAYANLFLYGATTPSRWEDGSADYEVGMFSYVAGARPKGAQGLLGFSDDNWFDGTQSGVFSFTDPSTYRDFGYGLTTTGIHEHGHHAGLSHPHDGYDPQSGVDYGPTGEFQYAWLGDMSATIMSYMDLSTGFSQFDLDNTARHRAASYWRVTNRVAADVQAAGGDLTAVDAALVEAQRAMADHDYPGTLAYARQAYDLALATADTAGVAAEQVEDGWYLPDRVKGKVGVKPRKDVVDADPAYVALRYLP